MMTLAAPERLWFLLGVVALLAAYLLAQRRRRRHAVRFAALPLLARVAPDPGWRRHVPAALFLLMVVLLVVAFARPQADVRKPREQATVVLAIDISGSMLATDISPDRFTVARKAADRFVSQLPAKYRVGLVPFSSTATVAVPPTTNRAVVREAIAALNPDGGTAIGDALISSVDSSQQAIGRTLEDPGTPPSADGTAQRIPARVVLLSDGANSLGHPVEDGIKAAVADHVQVSTIAYGTDSGHIGVQPVPVDRETLAQIADQTGGRAYTAASADELDAVYRNLGSSIGYRIERTEITSWFVGFGLVAALLAALASLRFTGRLP